jgi:hypothetical protein
LPDVISQIKIRGAGQTKLRDFISITAWNKAFLSRVFMTLTHAQIPGPLNRHGLLSSEPACFKGMLTPGDFNIPLHKYAKNWVCG